MSERKLLSSEEENESGSYRTTFVKAKDLLEGRRLPEYKELERVLSEAEGLFMNFFSRSVKLGMVVLRLSLGRVSGVLVFWLWLN